MARGLNVFVNIGARVGSSLGTATRQTIGQIDKVGRRARLVAAETKAAWAGMDGHFSRFNSHVSMPAAAFTALGARAAYEWSKVGNELQAVTQMSDQARKNIESVARSMPGNPAENLSAALDLARTGFDEKSIMASLGVTIKLGKADSSVDQAEAADIMTNVMKGMKMPDKTFAEITRSAERVANNIAFGAAKSSTDVRLMGESFKYAAPLAARLGIELEDLTGYFMTMADNGIKGSEAGVALRSGLVRMIKPTKGAMAVLERYNMRLEDYITANKKATAADVVGSLKGQGIDASGAQGAIAALLNNPNLSGAALIAKISEAVAAGMEGGADAADLDKISDGVMMAMTAGVTKVDLAKFIQDGVAKGWGASDFANFFDVRQGTRLSTLWGADTIRTINMVKAAMRVEQGNGSFLDQMYATQLKGAVGPWERMKQGFGNLIISMAESGVMDTVANGMNTIANALMSLSQSNPALLKFITYGIMGAAVLAPLGFALSGVASAFRVIGFVVRPMAGLLLRLLGPLVDLVPMLLNGLTRFAPLLIRGLVMLFGLLTNPIGWGIIIAGIGAALIWYFWDDIKAALPKLWEGFKGAMAKLKDFVMAINWKAVGLHIANAMTFGVVGAVGSVINRLKTTAATGNSGTPGGNMSGRATGGRVERGKTYMVGERGPEPFTPSASGYITTHSRMRASLRGGNGGGPLVGTLVVQGGQGSPGEIERAVHRALNRLANGQSALLSD